MKLVELTLCAILLVAPVMAQQNARQAAERTEYVSCWSDDLKDFRSRAARSRLLTSPDGQYSLFAEAVAEASGEGPNRVCLNNTRLFLVERRNVNEPVIVLTREGVRNGPPGNGVRIVDWSPDSQVALADLVTWYYTHGFDHHILLYTPENGHLVIHPVNKVFEAVAGKECVAYGELRGFLDSGNILFEGFPASEDEPDGPSCFASRGLWKIDRTSFAAAPFPKKPNIRNYGKRGPVPVLRQPCESGFADRPPYKVGSRVRPPRATVMTDPDDRHIRRGKYSGKVVLRAVVSAEGRAEKLCFLESPHPELDRAALKAVRDWEFEPGTMDGKPVPVVINIEFNFLLN